MKSSPSSPRNEIADPILYRLYFGQICKEVIHKLGYDATHGAKKLLHEFHKRVLGYETIAGRSQDIVSLFIFETIVWWSCHGMFIRTKEDMPIDIQEMPLSKCWQWL